MKLIDAIKHKGFPYWIPNTVRDDLPELFKELGFKTGAEIGVSVGENLEEYCKAGFTMYGIDPWIDYQDEKYRPISYLIRKGIVTKSFEDVYNLAVKKLAKYPNCTLIRKSSIEAADDFPNRSLDFVYIDANHKYGYVAMDLAKWTPKVRKWGIISGHDYYDRRGSRQNRGVKHAVDGFIKAYEINHFYVLGRKNPREGERIERSLSFMFFKHWDN